MKQTLFILLLYLIPTFLLGQQGIQGVVLDAGSREPMSFASVYINGTTKGTYTDDAGQFILEDVSSSSLLVVGYLGYETQSMVIRGNSGFLTILMPRKDILISELLIEGKNRRPEFLKIFKEQVFGTDKYGKSVILKNDSVLIFSYPEDDEKNEGIFLKAFSVAPLIVILPHLGYQIEIDLVDFNLYGTENNISRCDHLGHYYFTELEPESIRKKEKYKRERKKVYYNSAMHFYRSLYNNSLKENGYLIIGYEKIDEKRIRYNHEFGTDKNIWGQLKIENMKGKRLSVYYYQEKNKPLDITMTKKWNKKEDINKKLERFILSTNFEFASSILFFNDTCFINPQGTIPDNNIAFIGYISRNKMGTLLPEDYDPEK